MSDTTTTPNYGFIKPVPGADDDVWGDHLNQNTDALDSIIHGIDTRGPFVAKAGDTMTGPLNVPNGTLAAPSLALGAADGTGFNRTATALTIGVQGVQSASFFGGSAQVYGQLYMLNNRILQVADPTVATDALNMRTGDARYAAIGAGVTSWNTRTGAVTLTTADVTAAGGAPLNAPVFTGDPQAPTAAVGDADTSIATTAFVQTAVAPAQHNVGRNRLHNAGFGVDQRGYTSGTALAAGAYGHDRWKAGSGGCTYTFTQSQPFTTITITAGSLQQIVEAMNVEGGTYTLSWTGTAQGRVNAGAYAASPVTVTGLAVNTAITVEFNAGTAGRIQLEIGSVATPLEKPDPRYDISNCQRFYQTQTFTIGFPAYASGATTRVTLPLIQLMRAVPTVTVIPGTLTSAAAPTLAVATVTSVWLQTNATAAGGFVEAQGTFTASADL